MSVHYITLKRSVHYITLKRSSVTLSMLQFSQKLQSKAVQVGTVPWLPIQTELLALIASPSVSKTSSILLHAMSTAVMSAAERRFSDAPKRCTAVQTKSVIILGPVHQATDWLCFLKGPEAVAVTGIK